MDTAGQGRRPNSLMDEESDTTAGERMYLQKKKRSQSRRLCLIRSKLALTLLTRVVFIVLTLSTAGVITTSIWLMLDCRESFSTVRPILPNNAHFCTNMGMPALFACCTMLFALFGLGCTGRRLTGYALIIISSVEILQSATTLTFYKCNTLSYRDVAESVNSSLLSCQRPKGGADSTFIFSMAQTNSRPRQEPGHRSVRFAEVGLASAVHPWIGSRYFRSHLLQSKPFRKIRHWRVKFLKNEVRTVPFHSVAQTSVSRNDAPSTKTESTQKRSLASKIPFSQNAECSIDSPYFLDLSLTLKKSELNECIHVCKTYRAVCQNSTNVPFSTGASRQQSFSVSDSKLQLGDNALPRNHRTAKVGTSDTNAELWISDAVEAQVRDCGGKVFEHVSNLCYYDNEVILPLSMCAPMFYIAMSACFIYLALCDRKLKECQAGSIVIQVPITSPEKTWSWRRLICCTGQGYSFMPDTGSCMTKCTDSAWGEIGCCNCVPSPDHRLNSGCSTHELLHLRTLPSNSSLTSNRMSTTASQSTLNTCLTADSSPTLPVPNS